VVLGIAALAVFVALVRTRIDLAPRRNAAAWGVATSPALYQADAEERPGAAVALLVDTSGSMWQPPKSGGAPKYLIARQALQTILGATDAFVRHRPDYPVKLAVFGFSSMPWQVLPFGPYDHAAVESALQRLPLPGGGTAIGAALDAARVALYRSASVRKYILVVTDGENTAGVAPEPVARNIYAKSGGSVSISFIAFDTDPAVFGFLRDVGGSVVTAQDAAGLEKALLEIYDGKILAEAPEPSEATGRAR
jgi:Mg-chelatase subunit ChlD